MGPSSSGRAAAHRFGMAGKLQPAHRFQVVALEAEDRDVAVEEIRDIEEFSIGTESDAFSKSAYFRLAHLPHLFLGGVDLEQRDVGMRVIDETIVRQIRAVEDELGGIN